MNHPSTEPPKSFTPAPAGLATMVGLIVLVAGAPTLAAQSVDFNSGTDTGWTRYTLPAVYGAAFSFPDDGAGGKAYRIAAPPTGDDPYGVMNARAGSFRPDVTYSGRFSMAADMLSWNPVWSQETGLLFYVTDVGLGTTDGYAATYSSGYHALYISALVDESPTTIGELGGIMADTSHRYRLAVSSHDGYTLLFQIFDLTDPDSAWASAVCQDSYGHYSGGVCGLFVFEQNYPSATEGAEATFDNYVASKPAAGTMPATVTDLSPAPGTRASAMYPTVSVAILDRDTSVNPDSITLYLDGVQVPKASMTIDPQVLKTDNPAIGGETFPGATASYPIPTLYPWGSQHTNSVVFTDSASVRHTNTWTWTTAYPYLSAGKSLPPGSLTLRGFDVRMVQSANDGVNLANSLSRAEQQLAIPPTIPVSLTATTMVQVLSWDKTGTPAPVPGLIAGSYNNIAVESYAYLELSAGLHRFRIDTDDRAGLYCATSATDPDAVTMWENPGNTADATFDFVVEADGLYPIRSIWEETGGGAHHYLYSVDLNDVTEVAINDPSNPAGVVKAYYPLVCRSASTVTGPYTADATAVNLVTTVNVLDPEGGGTVVGQMVTGGTFTIPIPASTRFYVVEAPRGTRITNFQKSAANLVITYTVL